MEHKDGEMTGKGMMITLADGTQTIIACANKVRLTTGHTGSVHCWGGDGTVVVFVDAMKISHPMYSDFPPVKAFQCSGKHIAAILTNV